MNWTIRREQCIVGYTDGDDHWENRSNSDKLDCMLTERKLSRTGSVTVFRRETKIKYDKTMRSPSTRRLIDIFKRRCRGKIWRDKGQQRFEPSEAYFPEAEPRWNFTKQGWRLCDYEGEVKDVFSRSSRGRIRKNMVCYITLPSICRRNVCIFRK